MRRILRCVLSLWAWWDEKNIWEGFFSSNRRLKESRKTARIFIASSRVEVSEWFHCISVCMRKEWKSAFIFSISQLYVSSISTIASIGSVCIKRVSSSTFPIFIEHRDCKMAHHFSDSRMAASISAGCFFWLKIDCHEYQPENFSRNSENSFTPLKILRSSGFHQRKWFWK